MVGSKVPLHATAIGKLYLAFKPKFAETFFKKNKSLHSYNKFTLNTSQLKKNILQIQQKKFAMSNQETTLGLVGLAVPVFDTDHKIKCGIALQIPIHRFNQESKKSFLTILRKTALDIS